MGAMLSRMKAIEALERKRQEFRTFANEQAVAGERAGEMLTAFLAMPWEEIERALEEANAEWPGALPTQEIEIAEGLQIPFGAQWRNHEEARAWALETLRGRPVIAVDGSQIAPSKDLSLPVGVVQVGWFINEHSDAGSYTKDVAFEVISPRDLFDKDEGGDGHFPAWYVNQQRFVAECAKLCELMRAHAAQPDERKPLCFFDGSFIISFAGEIPPDRSEPYTSAVRALLDCSAETRVPLVGFVDGSFSHDLAELVALATGQTGRLRLSDAALVQLLLDDWGDRCPLFTCARLDSLSRKGRADFYRDVAFTYVKLTRDRPPARVEMPRWILDEGRAEEIIDLVRAECVVGAGYPYAIETADAVAVLSRQDRERFFALFQQFAEQEGLQLSLARKALSKQARRT